MITVESLHKSYGAVVALRDVSFTARDAQITGLLGPNGAGKTTTLRAISTLLRPDHGHARIDGLDTVNDQRAARRRLGVLPDNHGLYPRLTVREHLRYYGKLHGLRADALESRIDRLVVQLGMEDFADRRAQGFSRGQRLKVAIASTLIHQPGNLLLDEPTSGLDVMATRAMRTLIRELRDQGTCILFSSHMMQEVATLCDRVIVIAHGTVVGDGTPDELRALTRQDNMEEAFISLIGSAEGLNF